jgi:hypothetical protein
LIATSSPTRLAKPISASRSTYTTPQCSRANTLSSSAANVLSFMPHTYLVKEVAIHRIVFVAVR